jgi:hypothetical protein
MRLCLPCFDDMRRRSAVEIFGNKVPEQLTEPERWRPYRLLVKYVDGTSERTRVPPQTAAEFQVWLDKQIPALVFNRWNEDSPANVAEVRFYAGRARFLTFRPIANGDYPPLAYEDLEWCYTSDDLVGEGVRIQSSAKLFAPACKAWSGAWWRLQGGWNKPALESMWPAPEMQFVWREPSVYRPPAARPQPPVSEQKPSVVPIKTKRKFRL